MSKLILWVVAAIILLADAGTDTEVVKSFVNGGSILSLRSNSSVVMENKSNDILQSLSYAQRNASLTFDRVYDSANWYLKYVSILRYLGWTIDSSSLWHPVNEEATDLRSVIKNSMSPYLKEADLLQLEITIMKFLKLPTAAPAVMLFKDFSTVGDISNFQVILVHHTNYAEQVVIGFFKLITLEEQNKEDDDSIGALFTVNQASLNTTTYAKYRQYVKFTLSKLPKMIIGLD